MASDPLIFGLTDATLACLWAAANCLLVIVGGQLLGFKHTTNKLLADFDAAHLAAGRKAATHPAWWWTPLQVWSRSCEWGFRVLVHESGSPVVKASYVIDTFKGATPIVLLALMISYDNWSVGACAYLALHGSYGLLWVFKSSAFPDTRWEKKQTVFGVLMTATWLSMYWVGGISIIVLRTPVSPPRAALATVLYVCGIVAMIGSDCQKFFTLKHKKGLISDGWFARTRNPNYLGEIALYASFGVLAQLSLLWSHLLVTWTAVFLPNMWWKEHSFLRKNGWEAYAARSGLLLPMLFPAAAPDSKGKTDCELKPHERKSRGGASPSRGRGKVQ